MPGPEIFNDWLGWLLDTNQVWTVWWWEFWRAHPLAFWLAFAVGFGLIGMSAWMERFHGYRRR